MSRLRIGWPVGPFMLIVAAVQAVFAVLFFTRSPVAVELWPLPQTGEMMMIFLASIFAAAAASTVWAVLWGEPGSLVGIALDYVVIFLPLSLYALTLEPARGGGPSTFALITLGGVGMGVWMLWWSWRRPLRDPRRTPTVVTAAFLLFVVALVLAGLALIIQRPNMLPWAVTPELSVVAGAIFLGAAAYFAYALVRPRWTNAGGQLAGFLAYDLVLIVPFLTRFRTVYSGWSLSLTVYIAVVIGSGILAAWYLFVAPDTRITGAHPVRVGTSTDP
jgi:hypothetical protein